MESPVRLFGGTLKRWRIEIGGGLDWRGRSHTAPYGKLAVKL